MDLQVYVCMQSEHTVCDSLFLFIKCEKCVTEVEREASTSQTHFHHSSREGRIYGALFNLMCILKGNNRRINFIQPRPNVSVLQMSMTKPSWDGLLKEAKKRQQPPRFPISFLFCSVFSQPSQRSFTDAANTLNKTLWDWPLLRIRLKKLIFTWTFNKASKTVCQLWCWNIWRFCLDNEMIHKSKAASSDSLIFYFSSCSLIPNRYATSVCRFNSAHA